MIGEEARPNLFAIPVRSLLLISRCSDCLVESRRSSGYQTGRDKIRRHVFTLPVRSLLLKFVH